MQHYNHKTPGVSTFSFFWNCLSNDTSKIKHLVSLPSDVRKVRKINNLPLIGKPRNMLIHYAIIIIEIPDFFFDFFFFLENNNNYFAFSDYM